MDLGSAIVSNGNAGMKINEMNKIFVGLFTGV